MNIFDELKLCKDFVYVIDNKYYVIGANYFLKCPDNLINKYDNFIQIVKKLKTILKNQIPSKEVFDECMNSFEKLTSDIAKIIYNTNTNNDYYKIISDLDLSLNEEDKLKIKNQKNLFILFDDLQFKYKRNKIFNIRPEHLKELEKIVL